MSLSRAILRRAELEHEDDRRMLFSVFNGDLDDFSAVAMKWFEFPYRDCTVAGHYHKYREIFIVLEGCDVFYLVDVRTGEKQVIELTRGDVLLVPAYVAHLCSVKRGSLVVVAQDAPYVSPEHSDFAFDGV